MNEKDHSINSLYIAFADRDTPAICLKLTIALSNPSILLVSIL
jgi:hypothetical protein